MQWKDVGDLIGKVAGTAAPLIGTLIGGPAGGAVGSLIAAAFGCANTPDAIHQAISADPQAAVKLAEIEANSKIDLQKLAVTAEQNRLAAETSQITSVNATMQAEATNAANENWFQKGWRPLNGYIVAITTLISVCCVFGLAFMALWNKDQNAVAALGQLPAIVSSVVLIMTPSGAAVGITAWHRGKLQREQAQGAGS